ncbi:nuclear transport factor 2 family protein [Micromonospora endolithica]|uniref:Nuclear transport factor 2 family protein n=1 Tax=Micromonospora endolithica TaxID=230091 RepID=A0A3A9ZQQ5_9ACTN|nr:nuclear transport factor 2 family protein [Micromonospora endolithica]RKN50608.1 nuclear transport factor 2 family protein [Micromonospora endolithica]TWJ20669.1 SnoaL-like protein [Micromonospora endolithica]
MTGAEDTVLAYWAACEAREWERLGTLLAEDVVYHLPQTRERITGRAAFLRFNRDYPDGWHLRVTRAVGAGSRAATWITCDYAGSSLAATSFFDLDEAGLIATVTEFWPEPYEPPPGRAHLTERY